MGTQAKINRARKGTPAGPDTTVVIAFIHPGQTSAYFTTSLVGSLLYDRATAQRIVGLKNEWSSANVSQPRNNLTRQFLETTDAEWLWWIDADMGWDPMALDQLLEVADPVTAPIVGGLCFGAFHDMLFPTIYQFGQVDGKLTTVRMSDYPRDAVVEVASTGAAFLLIHRSALERMRDRGFNKTFPWFQETEMDGQPVGEDLTFCLRARMLEIPVHVNTAVKVGHHKSTLLTEERFLEQSQR
jgi:GT2 family glycosyltransferase